MKESIFVYCLSAKLLDMVYAIRDGDVLGTMEFAKESENDEWREELLLRVGKALFQRAEYNKAVECFSYCKAVTSSQLISLMPILGKKLALLWCANICNEEKDMSEQSKDEDTNENQDGASEVSVEAASAGASVAMQMLHTYNKCTKNGLENDEQTKLVTIASVLLSWSDRLHELEGLIHSYGLQCEEGALGALEGSTYDFCRALIHFGRRQWAQALQLFKHSARYDGAGFASLSCKEKAGERCSAYISHIAEHSSDEDLVGDALEWLCCYEQHAAFSSLRALVSADTFNVHKAVSLLNQHAPAYMLEFLEYAVYNLTVEDGDLHTYYATALIDKILKNTEEFSTTLGMKDSYETEPETRQKLLYHLRHSTSLDASAVLEHVESTGKIVLVCISLI